VLTGGSPVAIPEITELANALLYVWYPGEEGGRAVANVLFGDTVPSGRLPVTFPKSVDQLPPYEDYSMAGRTYKYMTGEPLFPFGYGLSYTKFEYADLRLDQTEVPAGQSIKIDVTVKNTGNRAADEVVQCYLSDLEASVRVPRYDLKGFQRIFLWPGQSRTVCFELTADAMKLVNNEGDLVLEPGQFRVTLGGSSPGPRALELGAPKPVSAVFTVR
jgi:beta-glucosidase